MSDFANLTTEELQRLWRRYWEHGKSANLPIQHRLGKELHERGLGGEVGYRSCPDCGADIYDDDTHVLDEQDREMNGYLPCEEGQGAMKTKLLFHKSDAPRLAIKSVVVDTGCPLFSNDHEKVPEVRELLDAGWELGGHIDGWEDAK